MYVTRLIHTYELVLSRIWEACVAVVSQWCCSGVIPCLKRDPHAPDWYRFRIFTRVNELRYITYVRDICCSVLQFEIDTQYSLMWITCVTYVRGVYCSVLQCVAVCCSAVAVLLQCCCSAVAVLLQFVRQGKRHVPLQCMWGACVAVCCSVLRCCCGVVALRESG